MAVLAGFSSAFTLPTPRPGKDEWKGAFLLVAALCTLILGLYHFPKGTVLNLDQPWRGWQLAGTIWTVLVATYHGLKHHRFRRNRRYGYQAVHVFLAAPVVITICAGLLYDFDPNQVFAWGNFFTALCFLGMNIVFSACLEKPKDCYVHGVMWRIIDLPAFFVSTILVWVVLTPGQESSDAMTGFVVGAATCELIASKVLFLIAEETIGQGGKFDTEEPKVNAAKA